MKTFPRQEAIPCPDPRGSGLRTTAHQRGVRALRSLRGLGVAADVPVRTWDEFALFREVPASLEHKIATKGKVLHEQSQAATRSDLAR